MRLRNKLGSLSLKRIAGSIFNSKLRYGLQLCCKVRTCETDAIAANLKLLSANQINAQVKLTEMWKAFNVTNYPIKLDKKDPNTDNRLIRSTARGDIYNFSFTTHK